MRNVLDCWPQWSQERLSELFETGKPATKRFHEFVNFLAETYSQEFPPDHPRFVKVGNSMDDSIYIFDMATETVRQINKW